MSCALPAIAVACGIEGILQRMHKAAVDVIIYLMDSHIFVIESEVAVVGIQYTARHINPSTCGKSKALRCEIIAETAYLPQ